MEAEFIQPGEEIMGDLVVSTTKWNRWSWTLQAKRSEQARDKLEVVRKILLGRKKEKHFHNKNG